MSVSIEQARQRAEEFIADLKAGAQAIAAKDNMVGSNVRRIMASEPFAVAKGAVDRTIERVSAVDLNAYVAQAQGYKTQAQEAAAAQWESFGSTSAGKKVHQAWDRVLAFAEQFSEVP